MREETLYHPLHELCLGSSSTNHCALACQSRLLGWTTPTLSQRCNKLYTQAGASNSRPPRNPTLCMYNACFKVGTLCPDRRPSVPLFYYPDHFNEHETGAQGDNKHAWAPSSSQTGSLCEVHMKLPWFLDIWLAPERCPTIFILDETFPYFFAAKFRPISTLVTRRSICWYLTNAVTSPFLMFWYRHLLIEVIVCPMNGGV